MTDRSFLLQVLMPLQSLLQELAVNLADIIEEWEWEPVEGLTSRHPSIQSGALCVVGTRTPIRSIVNFHAHYPDIDTVHENFPAPSREQIEQVIEIYGLGGRQVTLEITDCDVKDPVSITGASTKAAR